MIISKDPVINRRCYYVCVCDKCGDTFKRRSDYISFEYCKVCANAIGGQKRKTHGHNNKNSRLHVTWANMKKRCLNPKDKKYHIYGAIGIKVCDEWIDYEPFMNWSIENGYKENLTIDRIDNNKGYSPDNCRYVCVNTQNANKKITDKNKTGYIGVAKDRNRYESYVSWNGKKIFRKRYSTAKEAAIARDRFIKENNLPHTLNF